MLTSPHVLQRTVADILTPPHILQRTSADMLPSPHVLQRTLGDILTPPHVLQRTQEDMLPSLHVLQRPLADMRQSWHILHGTLGDMPRSEIGFLLLLLLSFFRSKSSHGRESTYVKKQNSRLVLTDEPAVIMFVMNYSERTLSNCSVFSTSLFHIWG